MPRGISLGLPLSRGAAPPPAWLFAEHALGGAPPSLFADFGRDIYGIGGVQKSFSDLFTVSSVAKAVVGPDRSLVTVPANTPAFDYSMGQRRLLLEGATTNLCLRSQDLSHASWSNRAGSPNVTVNNSGAPDGTSTLNMIQRTVTTATYVGQNFVKAASSITYTLSFFAKQGAVGRGIPVRIQATYPNRVDTNFNLVTGAVGSTTALGSGFTALGATITQLTPGIYYCTVTVTSDTTTGMSIFIGVKQDATSAAVDGTDTSSNADVYVWGFQLEQAVGASSYVATAGAQVTRVTDLCAFTPAANAAIPAATASVAYRANVRSPVLGQQLVGIASNNALLRADGGNAGIVRLGGSSGGNLGSILGLPGEVGIAAGWAAGTRSLCVNGNAAQVDALTMDQTMPPFFLGQSAGMTPSAVHFLGALVAWPVKGSNGALQSQARVYS
ncbi:phage head spike fiber domain-containing protein [Xanthobacter flavus]|uniref:phage head spike fiber domain-containing protein n=1 Tax=Xanthobacter flavus TaxID=281 RepID=UPI00372B9026